MTSAHPAPCFGPRLPALLLVAATRGLGANRAAQLLQRQEPWTPCRELPVPGAVTTRWAAHQSPKYPRPAHISGQSGVVCGQQTCQVAGRAIVRDELFSYRPAPPKGTGNVLYRHNAKPTTAVSRPLLGPPGEAMVRRHPSFNWLGFGRASKVGLIVVMERRQPANSHRRILRRREDPLWARSGGQFGRQASTTRADQRDAWHQG